MSRTGDTFTTTHTFINGEEVTVIDGDTSRASQFAAQVSVITEEHFAEWENLRNQLNGSPEEDGQHLPPIA